MITINIHGRIFHFPCDGISDELIIVLEKIVDKKPDRRLLGMPIYEVETIVEKSIDIYELGLSRVKREWSRSILLYTEHRYAPILRFLLKLEHWYWSSFMRTLREQGFFNTPIGERYSWRDHFLVLPRD